MYSADLHRLAQSGGGVALLNIFYRLLFFNFVPGCQSMQDAEAIKKFQLRQDFGERLDVEGDRLRFI